MSKTPEKDHSSHFTCTLDHAAWRNVINPHSWKTINEFLDFQAEEHGSHLAVVFPRFHLVGEENDWGFELIKGVGNDLASKGVNLVSRFGNAECGFLLSSHRDYESDKAWQYLCPLPGSPYLQFKKQEDGSGLSELIVLQGWPHIAISNRLDGTFHTGDLFEPHPTIVNAWRDHSRIDSRITLATGKKFDPEMIEGVFDDSEKLIREVLVFGNGQQFPGILVFPIKPVHLETQIRKIRDYAWQKLQTINSRGENYTRISKAMIIIINSSEPELPRSSKGTIMKGRAEKMFRIDINSAYNYEKMGKDEPTTSPTIRAPTDAEGIISSRCDPVPEKISIDAAETDDLGYLQNFKPFGLIPLKDWLDKLENLEDDPAQALARLWRRTYIHDYAKNLGLKLKKPYAIFATENTKRELPIMSHVPRIDQQLVAKIWTWMESERLAEGPET
ncbi:hypothetical protein G7Y89_g1923 [Cudoniella acicularis]|uniref:Uncharacterized protein n=1 Tax=Cudoniella acicularis TaxID=354080 RepID=A0A8H4RUD7_9HELO|nr:hypothetical protein G7Y89_g1923 [Cudoniella acicularis]